ncbi:DUF7344 domain-containing protein [Halobiforma nitratireducens]|uniref:DUF7344 domain-containing protein n=1 Tax=Halobiforma nitratireducens JCM 10879 TaxID=1227454 RepID=M0LFX6_9EURY|nr:hypothetical protein [Halobiforma nitratireducens]EMA30900.1 hypothetical protein C446_16255 [Halobiforma nitratireducens JCM 10879]
MSNTTSDRRPGHTGDDLFRALADETHRRLLRLVYDRSPAGIGKDELTLEFAAVTNDVPAEAVDDDDRRRARVDCHHRSLPALLDAGLLEETGDGKVVATDHWAYDDPDLERVVTGRTDASDDDLDALFEALAHERRRTILSVVGSRRRRLSTAELARAVAALENETIERDVAQERVDQVRTSLVHVHLPALSDDGLVEYDADAGHVAARREQIVGAAWVVDDSRDRSGTETGNGSETLAHDVDVRTLEGGEPLVAIRQP